MKNLKDVSETTPPTLVMIGIHLAFGCFRIKLIVLKEFAEAANVITTIREEGRYAMGMIAVSQRQIHTYPSVLTYVGFVEGSQSENFNRWKFLQSGKIATAFANLLKGRSDPFFLRILVKHWDDQVSVRFGDPGAVSVEP